MTSNFSLLMNTSAGPHALLLPTRSLNRIQVQLYGCHQSLDAHSYALTRVAREERSADRRKVVVDSRQRQRATPFVMGRVFVEA